MADSAPGSTLWDMMEASMSKSSKGFACACDCVTTWYCSVLMNAIRSQLDCVMYMCVRYTHSTKPCTLFCAHWTPIRAVRER